MRNTSLNFILTWYRAGQWMRHWPHLHHPFYRTILLGLYFNNINANSIIKVDLCAFLYFVGIQVEYINLKQYSLCIRLFFHFCPHATKSGIVHTNSNHGQRGRRVHITSSFLSYFMSLIIIYLHKKQIAKKPWYKKITFKDRIHVNFLW